MTETRPQIYLITPPTLADEFTDRLSSVLDAHPVACVRFAPSGANEDTIIRDADTLRALAHDRDIPLVISDHPQLADRLGLDGVHLGDGARNLRKVRADLGGDRIVGAFCGTSKHAGMSAGEIGADYVAFGPVGASVLGDGNTAPLDLFTWWSELIELPVVAEGGIDEPTMAALAPIADFIAIGDEIWRSSNPTAALGRLIRAMG